MDKTTSLIIRAIHCLLIAAIAGSISAAISLGRVSFVLIAVLILIAEIGLAVVSARSRAKESV